MPTEIDPPKRFIKTAQQELAARFEYDPVSATRGEEYQVNRTKLLNVARHFHRALPAGREQSLAITKLEEALFWANAAIARREDEE